MRHGTNPYGETLEVLVDLGRTVPVGRPRPRYSNLGYMLLGHALAAAAGTSYARLLLDRVTGRSSLTPSNVAALSGSYVSVSSSSATRVTAR